MYTTFDMNVSNNILLNAAKCQGNSCYRLRVIEGKPTRRREVKLLPPISENQSGFKLGNSCINQLLSITQEIYKSFDNCRELRGAFLHITKAYHKVWHEGLLLKLRLNITEYQEYLSWRIFYQIDIKELF